MMYNVVGKDTCNCRWVFFSLWYSLETVFNLN